MLKKYVEFGIGNRWLVRTEYELDDGSEYERKGIDRPKRITSIYIRIWIGKYVFILDTFEGFKRSKKTRNKLKIVLGISGTG